MESNYLLETPINRDNLIINDKYSIIVILTFISITITVILQVFILIYIMRMSDTAESLRIHKINSTEIIDYMNKAETIISYVCNKLIQC